MDFIISYQLACLITHLLITNKYHESGSRNNHGGIDSSTIISLGVRLITKPFRMGGKRTEHYSR